MSKEVVEKYEELRISIADNINTIRALLHQADLLNNLVSDLTDDDEKKAELEKNIKGLYQIINRLIVQTNELFKQYADFANSVTGVKAKQ